MSPAAWSVLRTAAALVAGVACTLAAVLAAILCVPVGGPPRCTCPVCSDEAAEGDDA